MFAVTLGWLGYQYGLSNVIAAYRADRTVSWLRQTWQEQGRSASPGAPIQIDAGETFAIIRFPSVGESHVWPVTSGHGGLNSGFAWYPSTAQPGQTGNFAVACHRITHGAPCVGLTDLAAGTEIIVETRDCVYTYAVVVPAAELTVASDAGWVLEPVPGRTDAVPWQPMLTITTAQDWVLSADRSVAFSVLTSKKVKQ